VRFHLLQAVLGQVHGYGCEPGREFRLPAKFLQVFISRNKSILYHLACVVIISNQPEGNIEHPFLMLSHEQLKRGKIAFLSRRYEYRVLILDSLVFAC